MPTDPPPDPTETNLARLVARYPQLMDAMRQAGALRTLQVTAHTTLFHEGDACPGFPLILRGEVRVARQGHDGRTLELYRVMPGELCLVSCACLFKTQPLTAEGVTVRDTELMLVPPDVFQAALADPVFRGDVLGLFAERMADLTALIDAVAFQRLDQRLAAALLGHGSVVHTTHQGLASDLGTVREMVSRVLHRFEREGLVRLEREAIHITDSAGLRLRAGGSAGR